MGEAAKPAPAEDKFYRIIEEGLCIGCGLCRSVVGEGRLRIVETDAGALRPRLEQPVAEEAVSAVYETCPGLRLTSLPVHLQDRDTRSDEIWGPHQAIHRVHAGDATMRHRAATGGALTALAVHMLESGLVHFILHAEADPARPSFGRRRISRTREEVLMGAGSRYGPTATLVDIDRWLALEEPFAFIGTPCDVSALRNLADRDPRVDRYCRMMMAPVCGGFMETPALNERLAAFGVEPAVLERLDYRGRGCPGPTRLQARDGRVVEKTYLDFWGEDDSAWSLPWRCKICADGIGEAADIAASDVWPGGAPTRAQAEDHTLDPGSNAVLVRSPRAAEMVAGAVASGALVLEGPVDPRQMDEWQPHQVRKKLSLQARFEGMRAAGRLVPAAEGLRLAELAERLPPQAQAEQREGTYQRLAAGKASERRPGPDAVAAEPD